MVCRDIPALIKPAGGAVSAGPFNATAVPPTCIPLRRLSKPLNASPTATLRKGCYCNPCVARNYRERHRLQPRYAAYHAVSRLLANIGENAAVHIQDVPVHKIARLAGQKNRRANQVIQMLTPSVSGRFNADELSNGCLPSALRFRNLERSAALRYSRARCRCIGCYSRHTRCKCCA